MNTMFKHFSVGILSVGLFAGAAQADSVTNLIQFFETNTLSDDNRQHHIDRNQSGTLDVGDSIRGVVLIDQLFNPGGPAGGFGLGRDSGNDEVTGIFQIMVESKVATGDAQFPFLYTFVPDPAFAAEFGFAVGTMAALFTDPSNNMALDSVTIAQAEATATDGSLLVTLGFTGGAGAAVGAGAAACSGAAGAAGAGPVPRLLRPARSRGPADLAGVARPGDPAPGGERLHAHLARRRAHRGGAAARRRPDQRILLAQPDQGGGRDRSAVPPSPGPGGCRRVSRAQGARGRGCDRGRRTGRAWRAAWGRRAPARP